MQLCVSATNLRPQINTQLVSPGPCLNETVKLFNCDLKHPIKEEWRRQLGQLKMKWKRQDHEGACLSVICIAALWIISLWLSTTSSDLDYFMFRIRCCSVQYTQRFCCYSPLLVPLRPVTYNGGTATALKIGAIWGVTPKRLCPVYFVSRSIRSTCFVVYNLKKLSLSFHRWLLWRCLNIYICELTCWLNRWPGYMTCNPSWWIIFVQTIVFLLNQVYLGVWTRRSLAREVTLVGCSGEQISAIEKEREHFTHLLQSLLIFLLHIFTSAAFYQTNC